MPRQLLLILLAAATALQTSTAETKPENRPAAQNRSIVIVELFTSEGCSSCPPADEVLAKVEGPEVIALGEHVTYWDRLGWKDRFSQSIFTERQEAYLEHFRLSSVYTPQAVVNGQAEVLGSDQGRVRKEIAKAASQPAASVELSMQSNDSVRYRVSGLPLGARSAEAFLAITESSIETAVKSGENGGRNLRHTGVVRSLRRLGRVTEGLTETVRVSTSSPSWKHENLKYVVFVQDPATRRIWGAASLRP